MPNDIKRPNKAISQKSFKILSILGKTPLKISEISENLDIPASTVYRIIRGLIGDGYVNKEKSLYALTLKGRKIIFAME